MTLPRTSAHGKKPAAASTSAANAAAAQKVKNRVGSKKTKHALPSPPRLERTTFATSREMDFFTERELVTQTGHPRSLWHLVALKELFDNALDICEEADLPPLIEIVANAAGISVTDNGPGLPEATLEGIKDFTIRVSNREAYVAPDRGAQGNALKTLLPMPCVLDPTAGRMIVTAHGKRHVITCAADPITQVPTIRDEAALLPTRGTTMRLEWQARTDADGDTVWPFDPDVTVHGPHASPDIQQQFREMLEGFALFNPHTTIKLNWFGEKVTWKATNPAWNKWKPCRPTSPHWYQLRHLERLIGAYIGHDRRLGQDRLVSDLLKEFDGLSGSQKRTRVLGETGLKRAKLSELVTGDTLDHDRVANLLRAMQQHTRPVQPAALGIIGEDHLRQRLLALDIDPQSFRYFRKLGGGKRKNTPAAPEDKACFVDDLPGIAEFAYGNLGEEAPDERRIFAGVNWSAALGNPFRTFGSTGEGLETSLAKLYASSTEPIVIAVHLAQPRIEYTDRGKSALVLKGR
jgi:DNA topoisomerase VI subunit B